MNVMAGVIGGMLGGLIGAAVWAGISYGTGYEIGWIAWGVGGLVGMGSIAGAKRGNAFMGVIAVVITILAIMVGKYAALQLTLMNEFGTKSDTIENAIANLEDDDLVISYLADEIIEDRLSRGENVEWPKGVDSTEANAEPDYPPEVWTEAASRWEQTADAERQEYREHLGEVVRQNIDAFYAAASQEGFLGGFAAMDLLFFGLAIVTAYRISASDQADGEPDDDGEEATENEEAAG